MIDAVCARIVMTYITSESPVTENLWSQKQRAAVAKELHIDEEKVEHLFKFICAEANRRRHTSRFTLGSERSSMNSNTNDIGLEEDDEEEESKSVDETGGTRIGQIPLTLDSCHALGRGVLMCGPMWKNKPSMLGSGSQIMRQVWLRPGYLAYTSGKITNHKDDSVRLIKLSDIDSVRVVLPFSFFFSPECQFSIICITHSIPQESSNTNPTLENRYKFTSHNPVRSAYRFARQKTRTMCLVVQTNLRRGRGHVPFEMR